MAYTMSAVYTMCSVTLRRFNKTTGVAAVPWPRMNWSLSLYMPQGHKIETPEQPAAVSWASGRHRRNDFLLCFLVFSRGAPF